MLTSSYNLYVSFGGVFISALFDSGASQSFIVAPQVIKFSNSAQKQLLCPLEPIKVHLAINSSIISHSTMQLPFLFSDSMQMNFG